MRASIKSIPFAGTDVLVATMDIIYKIHDVMNVKTIVHYVMPHIVIHVKKDSY